LARIKLGLIAVRDFDPAYDRCGSLGDILRLFGHVRFTPESRTQFKRYLSRADDALTMIAMKRPYCRRACQQENSRGLLDQVDEDILIALGLPLSARERVGLISLRSVIALLQVIVAARRNVDLMEAASLRAKLTAITTAETLEVQ
jgi:hypothetical protein